MEQKTERLYPSTPFENKDLEQRLKKESFDVNSLNNSIKNLKEKIQNFKDKNNKSKQKYEKFNWLTTILKSFDTFVIITTTSNSVT